MKKILIGLLIGLFIATSAYAAQRVVIVDGSDREVTSTGTSGAVKATPTNSSGTSITDDTNNAVYTRAKNLAWKTYRVKNSTGAYQTTNVSTATIPAGSILLGWDVFDLGLAGSESVVALHDCQSTDPYVDESLIDEDEAVDGQSLPNPWFAYPRTIALGLRIVQGAQTVVLVYYI